MQKLICFLHNKRKFKAIKKVKQFSSRTLLSIHPSISLADDDNDDDDAKCKVDAKNTPSVVCNYHFSSEKCLQKD